MNTLLKSSKELRIDLQELKIKTVHLVLFGHGNVGGQLIDQIIKSYDSIKSRRNISISIFAIANSSTIYYPHKSVPYNWQTQKIIEGFSYSISDVLRTIKKANLDNVVLVDNTADASFVDYYTQFIESGCHIISSNKTANTKSLSYYKGLREILAANNKHYLYETNVGAGLPLIDTIKLLHLSGENITRIKGVFSGSLSYIFNEYSSNQQLSFSDVVLKAKHKGYTEPDPREDLSGNDVARKLLILARELELDNEMSDIKVENLIPKALRKISNKSFFDQIQSLDTPYFIKRKNLKKDEVLRYIGDLRGDLSKENGAILEVKLVKVPLHSMLGQLKGSDSIFEIYTESYGDNPIIIQGAGAGAAVTARGVLGDIMRLAQGTL